MDDLGTPNMKKRSLSASREATENPERAVMLNWNMNIHPLLIEHVLENVFQYVLGSQEYGVNTVSAFRNERNTIVQDICNIRLVCKDWNKAVTKLFRQTRQPLRFETLIGPLSDNPALAMTRFLATMEHSQMIPVQGYRLGTYFFEKDHQQVTTDFFRICGPSAAELIFNYTDYYTCISLQNYPNLNLGNLKILKLSHHLARHSTRSVDIPSFVTSLLQAASSLQVFSLVMIGESYNEGWGLSLSPTFNEIVCRQLHNTITVLQLDVPLTEQHLKSLMVRNLKLVNFHLDLHTVAGTTTLEDFMLQQASSLTALKIYDSHPSESVPTNLPRLHHLTSLEIQGGKIKTLSYQDTFPRLKILNLSEYNNEEIIFQLFAPGNSSNLIEEVYFSHYFVMPWHIEMSSQNFPNLNTVRICNVSFASMEQVLPKVFLHFSKVKKLHLSFRHTLEFTRSADSLFSGLSHQECRQFRKRRNLNGGTLSGMGITSTILNMTNLRKLVVMGLPCEANFTEFAAQFIFLKMESLKELHIHRFTMRKKYHEMLKKKLRLKFLD